MLDSGGPGLLDRIFPSLSGFLRFRLPSGLAANESTCYPGFYGQAMNGAAVRCRTYNSVVDLAVLEKRSRKHASRLPRTSRFSKAFRRRHYRPSALAIHAHLDA